MLNRFLLLGALACLSSPALAGDPLPVQVPEPTSLAVLAAGIAGAAIVRKLRKPPGLTAFGPDSTMEVLPGPIAFLSNGLLPYAVVAALLVGEALFPDRRQVGESVWRWALHAALFACITFLGWAVAGLLAWAGNASHGSPPSAWAGWWHFLMVALVLDATLYLVHRVKHRVPLLWRFHRLHHSDTLLDATTTVRHHPIDSLVSGVVLGLVALAIGARPAEVGAYAAVALSVQALAHANLRLPGLGRILARAVVTAGLHHLHHAPQVRDTDSNYGEVLSIWDQMLGTFNAPRGRVERFGVEDATEQRIV